MPQVMSFLINFLLFQLAWFAGILGAAHQVPLIGVAIILVCVLFHLWRLQKSERRSESLFMWQCFFLGTLIDTGLMHAGIMVYASPNPISFLSPLWMSLLWVALAMTINHSLSWLKDRYLLSVILGAITGPLSYLAGVRMGAGEMPHEVLSLFVLAIVWALAMPLILFLSRRSLRHIRPL